MTSDGKLLSLAGHVQKKKYGTAGYALLGLPALSFKEQVTHDGARRRGVMGPSSAPHHVELRSEHLNIYELRGGVFYLLRALDLSQAPQVGELCLGPAERELGVARGRLERLLLKPDGRFVALSDGGQIYAGQLCTGPHDPQHDLLWWRGALRVDLEQGVDVSMSMLGDHVYVSALDVEAQVVYMARLGGGELTLYHGFESLCHPAITRLGVVTQPSSSQVCVFGQDGQELERFDVSAYNEAPESVEAVEAHQPEPARVPTPREHPGYVAADESGSQLLFVPWHAETIITLRDGQAHRRNISPQGSPESLWRRIFTGAVGELNDALRSWGLRVEVFAYEELGVQGSMSGLKTPPLPDTLRNLLLTGWINDLYTRIAIKVQGCHWGGYTLSGGVSEVTRPSTLEELRELLQWALEHQITPLALLSNYDRAYLPSMTMRPLPAPHSKEGGRLLRRAALESLPGHTWPHDTIPFRWMSEPISLEFTRELLSYLPSTPEHLDDDLCCSLGHPLRVGLERDDAIEALTWIICELDDRLTWEVPRAVAKPLGMLLRDDPRKREEVITRIQTSTRTVDWWPHERPIVLNAIRGA
jgi:hypothetical protein